jgi:hypothetical protein
MANKNPTSPPNFDTAERYHSKWLKNLKILSSRAKEYDAVGPRPILEVALRRVGARTGRLASTFSSFAEVR